MVKKIASLMSRVSAVAAFIFYMAVGIGFSLVSYQLGGLNKFFAGACIVLWVILWFLAVDDVGYDDD